MHQSVTNLEAILAEQKAIYQKLYALEKEKTDAIIEKKGSVIQEASAAQEALLVRVDELELKRKSIIEGFALFMKCLPHTVTLTDIAGLSGAKQAQRILDTGSELKKILIELKEKQDMNSRLIKDNLEFFEIFISGLKNSSSLKAGYDRDGKENVRVVNPVLFNTKV